MHALVCMHAHVYATELLQSNNTLDYIFDKYRTTQKQQQQKKKKKKHVIKRLSAYKHRHASESVCERESECF